MANLYDLANQLSIIHEKLEESGGELDPFIEEWLSQVEMGLQEKSVSIGKWVKNLNSDVDSLDKEIERLQIKKRRRQNVIDRLKNYVKSCMEQGGLAEINHPVFPIRICKNGGKLPVEITGDEIPDKFFDIIPERLVLNKDKIREAAEAGEDVSAFAKCERGTHLKIG